jgi:hypothetical protein
MRHKSFKIINHDRADLIIDQIKNEYKYEFCQIPELGFDGRLISIAERSIKDCLTHDYHCDIESPIWSSMVVSPGEVVFTHNLGFRPTGIMREAYTSHINSIYASNATGKSEEDVSILKINEITNWLRAWIFMESFDLKDDDINEIDGNGNIEDIEYETVSPCPFVVVTAMIFQQNALIAMEPDVTIHKRIPLVSAIPATVMVST